MDDGLSHGNMEKSATVKEFSYETHLNRKASSKGRTTRKSRGSSYSEGESWIMTKSRAASRLDKLTAESNS